MKNFFVVLMVLVLCTFANATSYYVDDTTGNDADDGTTEALAKLTIQAGINLAIAGDTVWIKRGAASYVPSALITIAVDDVNIKGYNLTVDETTLIGDCDEGQPFYKDETNGYAVLDYGNAAYNGFSFVDDSGIRIFNIKIEDMQATGQAILFDSSGATQYSNNVVNNCWIVATTRGATFGVGFDSQIGPQCLNCRFEGEFNGGQVTIVQLLRDSQEVALETP